MVAYREKKSWWMSLFWWAVFLLLFFSPVFAQEGNDCWSSIWSEVLPQSVSDKFEELWVPQIFFTDKQITFVQKSLNTYCCTSSQEICDEMNKDNELIPENKRVIHSLYYLDHFMLLWKLYLRGDPVVCASYWFECSTRIDNQNWLPGKPLCFREGESWDPACASIYKVWDGVDVMSADTETSSPGEYRWLYDTFWSEADNLTIPSVEEAANMDPVDLSIYQKGYYMCNEVSLIYDHVLGESIPWSVLQQCQVLMSQSFESHGFEYTSVLAKAAWVHQMAQINTQNRDHINSVLNDSVKRTMVILKARMTNLLRRFPEFTNTCSA